MHLKYCIEYMCNVGREVYAKLGSRNKMYLSSFSGWRLTQSSAFSGTGLKRYCLWTTMRFWVAGALVVFQESSKLDSERGVISFLLDKETVKRLCFFVPC